MSRKDYIQIANVISQENAKNDSHQWSEEAKRVHREAIFNVTAELAAMFKEDNSKFDRDRFFAACGFNQADS